MSEKVYAASCESEGWTEHTCTTCGFNYKDTFTAKRNHNYTKAEVAEATCTSAAVRTLHCEYCNDTYVDIAYGNSHPALGHDYPINRDGSYVWEVVTPRTCLEDGVYECECSRGDSTLRSVEKATGHTMVDNKKQLDGTTDIAICKADPKLHVDGSTQAYAFYCINEWCKPSEDEEINDVDYVETLPNDAQNATHNWVRVKDHNFNAFVTEEGDYYKAPTCTETGISTPKCSVCGTIDTENKKDVEALGHVINGVVSGKQVNGTDGYAPCEPDKSFEKYSDYASFLTAASNTYMGEKTKNTIAAASDYADLAKTLTYIKHEEGKSYSGVCLRCGSLEECKGHQFKIYKYAAGEDGKATLELEKEGDELKVYDAIDPEKACWYTERCEYFDFCHKSLTNAPHTPALPGTDGYKNCRHGTECTVCGKITDLKTDHHMIKVEDIAEGKPYAELADELAALKAAHDETFFLNIGAPSCNKEGASDFYICEYCLKDWEAVDAEKTDTNNPWNVKKYDNTLGTLDNKTNNGAYVASKSAHTWAKGYTGKKQTITKWYTTDGKEIDFSQTDCLAGIKMQDTCGECGTARITAKNAKYEGNEWKEGADNFTTDAEKKKITDGRTAGQDGLTLDMLTDKDGYYSVRTGSHVLAPLDDFWSSKTYKGTTCVDPAVITFGCVYCNTELTINAMYVGIDGKDYDFTTERKDEDGNLWDYDYTFANNEQIETARKNASIRKNFLKVSKDGTGLAGSSEKQEKDVWSLIYDVNPKNHKLPETLNTEALPCGLHCEACKGELEHETFKFEYRWSDKDELKLNSDGLKVTILVDGITEDEEGNPLNPGDDGYLAPLMVQVSKCQDGAVDWLATGIKLSLLTKDYIVLEDADGEKIEVTGIELYVDNALTQKVSELGEGYQEGSDKAAPTLVVYEGDVFFFTLDVAGEVGVDNTNPENVFGKTGEGGKRMEGYVQLKEGAEITLEGDENGWLWFGESDEAGTAESEDLVEANAKETVIDLNGGTIKWTPASQIVLPSSNVIIKNGTLESTYAGAITKLGDGNVAFGVAGSLTLENVTFKAPALAIMVYRGGSLYLKNTTIIAGQEAIEVQNFDKDGGPKLGKYTGNVRPAEDGKVVIENSTLVSLAEVSKKTVRFTDDTETLGKMPVMTIAANDVTIRESELIGLSNLIVVNGGKLTLEDTKLTVGLYKEAEGDGEASVDTTVYFLGKKGEATTPNRSEIKIGEDTVYYTPVESKCVMAGVLVELKDSASAEVSITGCTFTVPTTGEALCVNNGGTGNTCTVTYSGCTGLTAHHLAAGSATVNGKLEKK